MIELSHIEKRFGDNHVLRDISLTLAEGTVTALVGPSGGGKSTLLRCINGLETFDAGEVKIDELQLHSAAVRNHSAEVLLQLRRRVGMAHKAEAWPATLSGGQQQRVAIARALAPSPRVLLCDEPTSALDPELAEEVVEVLSRLAREGTTMVMATHDLRLASRVADAVVFLDGGVVVEEGPPRAIFTMPERERTKRFIASLSAPQSYDI
jgi:cystine transport system ATP-binding protein